MTAIRLGITAESHGGTAQVGGYLRWTPTARRYGDADVIVPSPFTVTLTQGEDPPIVDVTATTTQWVWSVFEQVPNGTPATRYLAVPNNAEAINYVDLIEIGRAHV